MNSYGSSGEIHVMELEAWFSLVLKVNGEKQNIFNIFKCENEDNDPKSISIMKILQI